MWNLGGLLARKTKTCIKQARASYKYYVMSDTLKQLNKFCYVPCCAPRVPKHKVTVVGAGSDVGRIACLMLKQQNIIKILSMYDSNVANNVVGAATDIAHIDTSTAVQAYQGSTLIARALCDSDVVLICGGRYPHPPECCMTDYDIFQHNLILVQSTIQACAYFCPYAIIAIQTPPVDANFALAKYTLKSLHEFNPRKLLGLNAINTMRLNQLISSTSGIALNDSHVPIVCGASKCSRVPVFSASKRVRRGRLTEEQKQFFVRILREGDDLICKIKSNYEQAHLSIGFASAMAVVSCMNGLFVQPTSIDSALVHQPDPKMTFGEKIFACPVTMGKDGIEKIEMPALDEWEKQMVERCRVDLQDMTNLGKTASKGEPYEIHKGKLCKPHILDPCPTCQPLENTEECRTLRGEKKKSSWFTK